MGSRQLPTECDRCGGVVDWGDFGDDPDNNLAGTTCTCTCEPELLVWLRGQVAKARKDAGTANHLGDKVRLTYLMGQVRAYNTMAAHLGYGSAEAPRTDKP
jgi:hypothetical protein